VIEKTTGVTIRSVHWTQEAPGLRQELSNRGSLHFSEILSSVNTPEMR